jgi:hypothetical protein
VSVSQRQRGPRAGVRSRVGHECERSGSGGGGGEGERWVTTESKETEI